MIVEHVRDGIVVCADSTLSSTVSHIVGLVGEVPLVIADGPYGNIVRETWDKTHNSDDEFAEWMHAWTKTWRSALLPGAAFYVWGGIGKPGFRPFLKYLTLAERPGAFELSNIITWKKRRAYGTSSNYLFTREECAYFVNGDAKKPRCFNVPLLEEKRGYAGFNDKYPAKSECYRRSNVWTDIGELMCGKGHPTQKAQRLHEVMIEVHTSPGEVVIDPFAGYGTTALAARKLGRRFVAVESDSGYFEQMLERLR